MCTHPDIAYVTMALVQYNISLTKAHLPVAKGILHYLADTAELSLEFGMDKSVISEPVCGVDTHCTGMNVKV